MICFPDLQYIYYVVCAILVYWCLFSSLLFTLILTSDSNSDVLLFKSFVFSAPFSGTLATLQNGWFSWCVFIPLPVRTVPIFPDCWPGTLGFFSLLNFNWLPPSDSVWQPLSILCSYHIQVSCCSSSQVLCYISLKPCTLVLNEFLFPHTNLFS